MNDIINKNELNKNVIKSMIHGEISNYIYNNLQKDDDVGNVWEDLEPYIRRINRKIDESEFEDEDYFDDDEDEDLAYKAAEVEINRICKKDNQEEKETLEQIIQRLEEDDENDEYEYSEDTDDIENDRDDEEENITPMASNERAKNAWRKYIESKQYTPPFANVRNVISGGSEIKLSDGDRNRLLIHAGLIEPNKTTIEEGLCYPFAIEMKRLAGIKQNHPKRLAKQLLNEWNTINYWKEKHLLHG